MIFPKTMKINKGMRSRKPPLAMKTLQSSLLLAISMKPWWCQTANLCSIQVSGITISYCSNETSHDHNVEFGNNNTIVKWIQQLVPSVKIFHFRSTGCAGWFAFCSFSYYSININLTWSYGEACHFKGLLISKLMALLKG